MKKKAIVLMLCMALVMSTLVGCGTKEEKSKENEKHKIILITMDSLDRYWVALDKGAQKAVAESGNVDYKWMAPDKKNDAEQIERVNNAIADGAEAIIIAANGPEAVSKSLEEAKEAGIKIVYVDSPAKTEAVATFTTDNKAAGKTAGEKMIEALEGKGITEGKIGIVNVNTSTASVVSREEGFREAFAGTGFTLLETQYGEGDVIKSQDIADNYITDGCIGMFGTSEGGSVGVGNAIKSDGNKVVGVGFDNSDAIGELIKGDALIATMEQNPGIMGYEGVMAAMKAINGEEIKESKVDTGVSVVTKETIN